MRGGPATCEHAPELRCCVAQMGDVVVYVSWAVDVGVSVGGRDLYGCCCPGVAVHPAILNVLSVHRDPDTYGPQTDFLYTKTSVTDLIITGGGMIIGL